MNRTYAALLIYLGLVSAALAQNTITMPPPSGVTIIGLQVVTTCGTASGLAAGKIAYAVMDTTGVLCTAGGGGGGGTAIQGNAGTNAQAWWVRIGDATNGPAAVKPASTAPIATDPALVVSLSPNSAGITAPGAQPAANSTAVTIGPAVLGSYCIGLNSGTIAAGLAAGSPVYSFRYGGGNLAIVRKIAAEADDITTAFVAGSGKFDLIAARSFTASDTGGTAATLTGNNGKLRTSFATTAVSNIQVANTGTMTAGTRTLDASALATVEFPVPTAIDSDLLPTTELLKANVGEQPLQLATNEGFVIQATVPGTGTWVMSVRVCWDEVSAF